MPVTRRRFGFSGGEDPFFPSFHCAVSDLLREMGPSARAAVPALRRRAIDLHPRIRLHARVALVAVDGESWFDPALAALRSSIRTSEAVPLNHKIFSHGAETMPLGWALRALGSRSVIRVLPLLEDAREHTRMVCLEALRDAGEIAAVARPQVIERLADSDFRVRDSAARALEELGVGTEELPRVLDLLVHRDAAVRADVVEALRSLEGEIAPRCRAADLPSD